jgi:hypothetical protein
MRIIALALAALLVLAPATAEAKCFLFFCWRPHHHREHHASKRERAQDRFCNGVMPAWTKLGPLADKEKFISAFPPKARDAVRNCIAVEE